MRFLSTLLFIAVLAYGAWPYYHVYGLDRALQADNREKLEQLIDIAAVRTARKQQLDHALDRTVGSDPGNPVTQMLRQGATALGGSSVDATVNLDWVRETLAGRSLRPGEPYPSLIDRIDFAFFEAPAEFLIRLGPLGDHPIHIVMTLDGWQWRVSAIYD
jgi:hypothetical protein